MDKMPVHCRVTPSIKFSAIHFIQLGGEKHYKCFGEVSCPRTQCSDPCQNFGEGDSNLESSMLTIKLS